MSRFSPSDQWVGPRSSLVTLRSLIFQPDHQVAPISSLVTVPRLRAVFANIRGSSRASAGRDPHAARRRSTPGFRAFAAIAAGSIACSPLDTRARNSIFAGGAGGDRGQTASGNTGIDVVGSSSRGFRSSGDRIMPRRAPSADVARAYAVIPIAVFTSIDAGTASSSPFQRTPKYVHDHAGIVFTFRWNLRSRCAGNRDHERPEYAIKRLPLAIGGSLRAAKPCLA